MNRVLSVLIISLSLVILGLGVWGSVVAFEPASMDKKEPAKLVAHKNQLKVAGPVLVVIGVLLVVMETMHHL